MQNQFERYMLLSKIDKQQHKSDILHSQIFFDWDAAIPIQMLDVKWSHFRLSPITMQYIMSIQTDKLNWY